MIKSEKPEEYSFWKAIRGTIAFIPTMYPVLVILFIDGLSLAVYSSEISHLLPPDTPKDDKNKLAGIATISLGTGAAIGGYLSGFISDKVGGLLAGRIGLCSWLVSCAVFISAIWWPSLWLAFLAAFLWGFSLFFIEGWMYIVCSRYY